jgi:hypothetical protein
MPDPHFFFLCGRRGGAALLLALDIRMGGAEKHINGTFMSFSAIGVACGRSLGAVAGYPACCRISSCPRLTLKGEAWVGKIPFLGVVRA